MLYTTRGIVLQVFPYTDNSVTAKIYTELFGLQSYLINAAHSKKSATKINLLQPLSLVECVVYNKGKKQLQRIKEIKCERPFLSIPNDIIKSSIVLFLDEVLYKSIREEECNKPLFEFIRSSLLILDLEKGSCANFHLYFMLQLSRHLGFYPAGKISEYEKYFDLQDGTFKMTEPAHPLYADAQLSRKLFEFMGSSYAALASLDISALQRKQLLEKLVTYFELHLHSLRGINSHRVLEEIF